MKNVGFIVEKNELTFFKLLGASIKFARTSEEANNALKEMLNANYAIIYLTKKTKSLISNLNLLNNQSNQQTIITTLPLWI